MKIYIAVDGDNVGRRLGVLIDTNASDTQVAAFASGVAEEMREFADIAAGKHGATILLCSGDSVLLSADGSQVSAILQLLSKTKCCTYSAGTGRTAKEAALCLQYAKLNGKNQTWHWQKVKPFRLWLRIESPFAILSKYAKGHF